MVINQIGRETDLAHISLFTGAGGLDIGLESAGYTTRMRVENDRFCRLTLELNRGRFRDPGCVLFGDITEVRPQQLLGAAGLKPGQAGLVSGGPPCQSYSTAGRRGSVADPRGSLFFQFSEAVDVIRPRFFLMENVRGLLSAAIRHRPLHLRGNGHRPLEREEELGSLLAEKIVPEFEAMGYQVIYGLLNAADYGAAQDRQRLIFIGSRDRELEDFAGVGGQGNVKALVHPTHDKHGHNGLPRWRTLRKGLKGLSEREPEYIPYSKARVEIFEKIPAGRNWRYLRDTFGEEYAREVLGGAYDATGGRVGFWRRLSFDKWAPTLPTSPIQKGTALCHPVETRPLSVREYALLQGFPNKWEFAGPTAEKYRQIGNAVPIQLAAALGRALVALVTVSTEKRSNAALHAAD